MDEGSGVGSDGILVAEGEAGVCVAVDAGTS